MARETEIKLRIENVAAFRKKVKKLGAKPIKSAAGRMFEQNVIFDTPDGGLAKHGQLLRIRTERLGKSRSSTRRRAKGKTEKERVVLTFKSPSMGESELASAGAAAAAGTQKASGTHGRLEHVSRHKVREEIEVEVADAATLAKIFHGLGLKGWFRYEKYRTTYALPASARWASGLLIELDETPIGSFVELEGAPEAIDRAAISLGFSPKDYVLKNYLQLHIEDCRRRGQEPHDMVFPS
ncbi:MAG: hypothetical protein AUI53_02190 [Acidobacteria bacterium 13_1_40CM_2_60_7]|nr:MAG: hypothetical protein AUH88_02990 [Acidobacteria bacterium 13_1_40CM_4_61_5]OLD62250.1 MAG: hypothetical protein AUI53_02190 [Acidobacteria bacterium 13_1_40CM_2_60_7]PYU06111.1 MAG: hypothetical protein DMG33_08915 [Acidobacteriota bacterium]